MTSIVPINLGFIGGATLERLEGHLRNSEFKEIQQILNQESDPFIRKFWLSDHASSHEFHPVLMCELALLEFEIAPFIDTAVRISIPLIEAARFRAFQDYTCHYSTVTNGFSFEAAEAFKEPYMQKLKTKMTEQIVGYDEEMLTEPRNRTLQSYFHLLRIQEIAETTFQYTTALANPRWITVRPFARDRSLNRPFLGDDVVLVCRRMQALHSEMSRMYGIEGGDVLVALENMRKEMEKSRVLRRGLHQESPFSCMCVIS